VDSLQGQLLLAEATLTDPNFRRTAVLVAEHSDAGALGLVLSRPTETPVTEVSAELAAVCEPGAVVHAGGPVEPGGIIVLAEFEDPGQAAMLILGGVGLLTSGAALGDLEDRVRRARVFAGHAGWGPGQLEGEIEADGWMVEPAARDELFAEGADELWSRVLRRKGGRHALLARMPDDPSVN